jgi:hypothetical protein
VIIATGNVEPGETLPGITYTKRGIEVDKNTFMTSIPGVFAGGNAIGGSKMAIRSAAHGKAMAVSVNSMLMGEAIEDRKRFNSALGKLRPEEHSEMLKGAGTDRRVGMENRDPSGLNEEDAVREALRCMHCDCRKQDGCDLRRLAGLYGAKQNRFGAGERKPVTRIITHDQLIFEPGKCIKCGRCVRIAARADEAFGLTFSGRGFETLLEVPFGEPLHKALKHDPREYVRNCPTAAIAWTRSDEEKD